MVSVAEYDDDDDNDDDDDYTYKCEAERDRADVKRYSVTKAKKIKIGFIVTLSFAQYLQGGKHDRAIRAFVRIALTV